MFRNCLDISDRHASKNLLLINFGAPRLYIKKYVLTVSDDYPE